MNPFREPTLILAELRAASKEQFGALVQEFGFSLLSHEQVPADAFGALLAYLQSPELIARSDGWMLVQLLPTNWHMLSAEQQVAIRPVLVEIFSRFRDSTAPMVISEILGELYCDEEALRQLAHLATHAPMPARALTPHGLKALAQTTQDAGLKQRAILRLQALATDPVREVREEAALALARF